MAKPTINPRKTTRIPLVGTSYSRPIKHSGSPLYQALLDQQFINCWFKKITNPLTNKEQVWVYKRPGFESSTSVPNALTFFTAMLDAQGTYSLYENTSNDLMIIYLAGTVKQTIAATNVTGTSQITPCIPAEDQIGYAFWFDDNGTRKAYIYNHSTDTPVEITDADFPDNGLAGSAIGEMTGNFVYKNGRLFIMTGTNGRIYNSDLAALTSWEATSYISVQTQRDGATLATYKDLIVAFGADYIEFFEDVGNSVGSPLQRRDDLRIQDYGVIHGQSNEAVTPHYVYKAYDTVFWLNNSETNSGIGLYMLDNYKPVKISDSEFDNFLSDDFEATFIGSFALFGQRYIYIANSDYYLIYDIDLKISTIWNPTLTGQCGMLLNGEFEGANSKVHIFTDTKRLDISPAGLAYTDIGSAYTMSIRTGIIDFDTEKRKRLHKLALIGLDSRSAASVNVSWSNDDYANYSTVRTVDMNNQRTYLTNCGSFRRRSFKIENSSDDPITLSDLEFEYSELTK